MIRSARAAHLGKVGTTLARAVLLGGLCLLSLPAVAQTYDPCRSELECKLAKALSRAFTPPGGHRPAPPMPPASLPAPPPQAKPNQEEWKRAIIAEAERFCATFPSDPICHFQDQQ
jgi:hypothetical protein